MNPQITAVQLLQDAGTTKRARKAWEATTALDRASGLHPGPHFSQEFTFLVQCEPSVWGRQQGARAP